MKIELSDFVSTFFLTVKERLSQEEIEEGLEEEEFEFLVGISDHAQKRMKLRDIGEYELNMLLTRMGDKLLKIHNLTEFAVVDRECGIGVICGMYLQDGQLIISLITVLSNEQLYVTRGTKVYNVALFSD